MSGREGTPGIFEILSSETVSVKLSQLTFAGASFGMYPLKNVSGG